MPPATRPKIYLVRQSFRVVLLGDVNVGKSSLALNFIKSHKAGYGEYLPTIGAAFVSRVLQVEGIDDDAIGRRQSFKLEIWDTAGEERFHSIAPLYYRGAQAAVIVYDVIDDHSYMRAKKWFTELQERADEGIVISLAGNKAGLDGGRIVERADAADYAKAKGALFFETSAVSGCNVEIMFSELAKRCAENWGKKCCESGQHRGRGRVRLVRGVRQAEQGGGCC